LWKTPLILLFHAQGNGSEKVWSMDLTAFPITLRHTVGESYLDEMGHMNVMWYIHLFSRAAGNLFAMLGLNEDYFVINQAGTFALQMHVRYLKEVRAGNSVVIRSRVLGRSVKRMHFIHFMCLEETGKLAATEEAIGTHVDMKTRRTSPLPAHVTEAFDRLLAEHGKQGVEARLCGVMKP
ncbi:MAG TPA: thioesterase family protein, partial [Gemmataceae bacterium]|nr:thioesterase family protein [Gemmataceae bacterium]